MIETLQDKSRRIHKRLAVATNVFSTRNGLPFGRIFGISQREFILSCTAPLEAGETLELTVEIPELDGRRLIELSAMCIWCQASENTTDFEAGFHIVNISDQNQVALNYFIRDF